MDKINIVALKAGPVDFLCLVNMELDYNYLPDIDVSDSVVWNHYDKIVISTLDEPSEGFVCCYDDKGDILLKVPCSNVAYIEY